MSKGGHFPALEEPGLLVDDLRTFFRGIGIGDPLFEVSLSISNLKRMLPRGSSHVRVDLLLRGAIHD